MKGRQGDVEHGKKTEGDEEEQVGGLGMNWS